MDISVDHSFDDIEQALLQSAPSLPAHFSFSWQNIHFRGHVSKEKTNIILRLVCDLVPIPFSAESSERRIILKSLCDRRVKLTHGRYFQSQRRWLSYEIERLLDAPVTGANILKMTAESLLLARVYIAATEDDNLAALT